MQVRECCGPLMFVNFGLDPSLPGVMCMKCRKVSAAETREEAVRLWNAQEFVQSGAPEIPMEVQP